MLMRTYRLIGRVASVLGAVTAAVLATAGSASAHVTVTPKDATQGGYGRIAFRVPNESDTATTTRLEVVLPENAPIPSVSTMPVPGWTLTVRRRVVDPPMQVHGSPVSEVVSRLIWTADKDAAIKPGQFQEFPVSLGPLPAVDRLVFKALQTYSDGNVVRWIEEPAEGNEEPEKPAPVLILVATSPSPPAGGSANSGGRADGEDGEGTGTALGAAGLVAGLAGLVLGGVAFARTRRLGQEARP